MGDTSLVFNLVARDRASGVMDGVAEKFNASAAAIGAGTAAALGVGIATNMDMEAANDQLAAQLGLTAPESQRIGKVAGNLYSDAYGESIQEVNAAVGSVMSSIKGMSDASAADLQTASANALNFAKTFEIDVAQGVQYVGTLINAGLAKDATEGFDLVTAASQRVPAHLREDILEAANEYGQFFKTLGYNGEESFALLVDASAKGMYGIDKAGDAIKEFTVLSTDMSTNSQAAYKTIGLDAKDMANAILSGGDKAHSATQKIIDGLLKIKDPATQANTAIALFGTPLEDLNVTEIPAFLASLKGASGSMDGFAGSSKKAGDALNDNAGSALETFKRKALTELGAAAGVIVQFGMENRGAVEPLIKVFTALAALVITVKAAMMVYTAVSTVVTAAHAIMTASAWTVIANWIRMNAIGLATYARIAGAAVLSAGTTAAAWVGSALVSIGTWVAAVVRAGAVAVGQFVMMAARAVAWAVVMAAQWLIAMGPVGWVIAAVVGLAALIILNWDKIKSFTGKAWDWVWSKIKGVGTMLLGFITNLPIVRFFLSHWDRIKTGTVSKVLGLISFVRGLPGRIGSAIGSLNNLLYNKGRDLVLGLWNGIKAMGGWLKDTLMGWARNLIPGPIAKALGIGSPSKVMAEVVGRWIPAGVVEGIRSGQGSVDRTMAGLVQPPPVGAVMGAGRSIGAGASAPLSRTGGGQAVYQINLVVDGKTLARAIFDPFRGELRRHGGTASLG